MVSEYKQTCGYSIGALKDFIYLIPYGVDRFSYSIDNGFCSEVGINEPSGIIRIEGFQVQLKNTESFDGRLKYDSEVSMYVHETLGKNLYDRLKFLINNRWFVVVEDKRGIQYIQSVEFFSEFEYNISLTDQNNGQNRIQLRFKGSSNFPTMIMQSPLQKSEATLLIGSDCRYIGGGISDLKMCDYKYVLIKESNHEISKISTTAGQSFKQIDFIKKSFTYTQNYADGVFEDTITFSIPLSDYKFYWQNNVVEFKDNRYVVTFRTANDNLYAVGYDEGASVSYVIETSTAVNTLNKITITLKYISTEGVYMSSGDDSIFDFDKTILYKPANDYINGAATKECIGNGMAYITLIQKYTASGVAIDEYLVLEGYESKYSGVNIVGTYTLDSDYGFPLQVSYPQCGQQGSCDTKNGIVNPYIFSASQKTRMFTFTSTCKYTLQNIPEWLDVTINEDTVIMTVKDGLTETKSATFYIKTSDGNMYNVNVNYVGEGGGLGWDVKPKTITIDYQKQYVAVSISGDVTSGDLTFESTTLSEHYWNGKDLKVRVPENTSKSIKYYTFTLNNSQKGDKIQITVIQTPKGEDDWRLVERDYICESGNKYKKYELYINDKATGTYRKGELIESSSEDCGMKQYRWYYDGVSAMCDGINEYQWLKEEVSWNGGITWQSTGNTKFGALIETNSEKCNPDHVKYKNTGRTKCDDGIVCEVWEKYVDDVAQGIYKEKNCHEDESVCPKKMVKLVLTKLTQCVDRGNGVCDSWYLNEEYYSFDGGETWQANGTYKVSDEMAVKDDAACQCPNHDDWKYERWWWDEKSILCDDDSYGCKIENVWIPYGFKFKNQAEKYKWGIFEDKTITAVWDEPCDIKTRLTDISDLCKGCENLEYFAPMDCTNFDSIAYAFENCISLTNFPLKNTRNNILVGAYRAFYNCSSMQGEGKLDLYMIGGRCDEMFYGCSLDSIDFGDCFIAKNTGVVPNNFIDNSKLRIVKGLNFKYITKYDEEGVTVKRWSCDTIETLYIKNIGVNFDFTLMPKIDKDSIDYIYHNAQSTTDKIKFYYNQTNLNKWGTLPTGKSNIIFTKR